MGQSTRIFCVRGYGLDRGYVLGELVARVRTLIVASFGTSGAETLVEVKVEDPGGVEMAVAGFIEAGPFGVETTAPGVFWECPKAKSVFRRTL